MIKYAMTTHFFVKNIPENIIRTLKKNFERKETTANVYGTAAVIIKTALRPSQDSCWISRKRTHLYNTQSENGVLTA